MTLAVILLNVSFALSPYTATAVLFPSSPQSPQDNKPANATPGQDQDKDQSNTQSQTPAKQSQPQTAQPAPSQSPSSTNPTQKPTTTTAPAKHRLHNKKKAQSTNCNPTPAASDSPTTDSAQSSKAATDPPAGSTSATNAPAQSTNCPPSKVIVPQGSTKEPSIQLLGGPDNSPAHDANQYLQSTEDNLKKIAGRQLSSNQRDMVTQINQFVDQSKKATASGNLDSARTLAWKAQLLSEELVNPQK